MESGELADSRERAVILSLYSFITIWVVRTDCIVWCHNIIKK